MRITKLPREQNPYFLTGRGKKKSWFFQIWRLSKGRDARASLAATRVSSSLACFQNLAV